MSSDSETSPRARFRFGFTGKRKSTGPAQETLVSSDDILDSLTRQAASQLGFRDERTRSLEVLTGEEEISRSESTISTLTQFGQARNRRFGHYAILMMSIGGMVLVWFYTSSKSLFSPSLLNNIIGSTGVRSIFANPVQVGIMSVVALIVALLIAVRRRASSLRLEV